MVNNDKKSWDVLVSKDQPRRRYVPVKHRIIYGKCQKKCKFWRSNPDGDGLFTFCVNSEMVRLIDVFSWTNVDLGIPCSTKCKYFEFEKPERVVWIHTKGWYQKYLERDINFVDNKFYGQSKEPKGHQLVLIFLGGYWNRGHYYLAKYHELPWRAFPLKKYRVGGS